MSDFGSDPFGGYKPSDPRSTAPAPQPEPRGGGGVPQSIPHERKMPPELAEQMRALGVWADANAKDARSQQFMFWAFKAPVIVSAAASGLLGLAHQGVLSAVVGAFASLGALLDANAKPGRLFPFYQKAVYDLRSVAGNADDLWAAGILKAGADPNSLASEIIELTAKKKVAISDSLAKATTTLGTGRRT
jgi:hypothetical protein